MPPLEIRDCEDRDVEGVRRIYAHYVRTSPVTFEEEVPALEEMRRRREAVLGAGYAYLAARRDGEVVGYAYASAYRTRSAYRFTLEDSVYVREDCTRQGIGSGLLDALIARCRAQPYRRMVAIIGDRSVPSVELHRGRGFALVGHLTGVGFKFGRWFDTTLMELDLSSAP